MRARTKPIADPSGSGIWRVDVKSGGQTEVNSPNGRLNMPELAEHEERAIRDYVNSQSPPEDRAGIIQRAHSQRILGRVHEVFDVHCEKTRWWVITEPTNLYLQTDFPQAEQALIFHIGLGVVLAERSRAELEVDQEEHVTAPWRRYRDALNVMNEADEAEDFQSVGIKCRDSLIALGKQYQDASWLGELSERPRVADFKGWGCIYAECLSDGRVRQYVKALVERTWDLSVALQHDSNATPMDADLVLEATAHLIGTMSRLIRRAEVGDPERCPKCDSYRLDEDVQHDEEAQGFYVSTVCAACGWESDSTFTLWRDHFEGTRLEEYLSAPGTGISDQLHRTEDAG